MKRSRSNVPEADLSTVVTVIIIAVMLGIVTLGYSSLAVRADMKAYAEGGTAASFIKIDRAAVSQELPPGFRRPPPPQIVDERKLTNELHPVTYCEDMSMAPGWNIKLGPPATLPVSHP